MKGARPLSGKAKTEFSRADLNSVSLRCTKGDEADQRDEVRHVAVQRMQQVQSHRRP